MKANENKSTHVTFTLNRENYRTVTLNGNQFPRGETDKFLYIYLDRRLTWRTQVFARRKQLGLKFQQMYWTLGRKSELSIEYKLQMYKTILNTIWTYGITFWGAASNSNIEILQKYQHMTEISK